MRHPKLWIPFLHNPNYSLTHTTPPGFFGIPQFPFSHTVWPSYLFFILFYTLFFALYVLHLCLGLLFYSPNWLVSISVIFQSLYFLFLAYQSTPPPSCGGEIVFVLSVRELLIYSWSRLDAPMPTGAIFSDYNRVLTIHNVQLAHEGTYRCRVTRQLGQETYGDLTIAIEGTSHSPPCSVGCSAEVLNTLKLFWSIIVVWCCCVALEWALSTLFS